MIETILLGGFGLITLITVFNNSSSNARIQRKGNVIKPITTNSFTENVKYFIKDYGFLFIPILNVIKSVKDVIKKDAIFDSERFAKLQDRDRIAVVKPATPAKKAPAPAPAKVEEDDDELDEDLEDPELKTAPVRVTPAVKRSPVDAMDCYERKDYYHREYLRLVALHHRSKNAGKSVAELNKITAQITKVVAEYTKAQRECKIEDLKAAKNEVLATMGTTRILR